jgi:hypothetical protein
MRTSAAIVPLLFGKSSGHASSAVSVVIYLGEIQGVNSSYV